MDGNAEYGSVFGEGNKGTEEAEEKLKKLVYVSGPISRGDQFRNVQAGIDAFNLLLNAGIYAHCPHFTAFAHMTHPRPHDVWLDLDINAILPRCSAVYRLPGESVGADYEVKNAKMLGLPVFTDFTELVQWHQACEQQDRRAVGTEGRV